LSSSSSSESIDHHLPSRRKKASRIHMKAVMSNQGIDAQKEECGMAILR